METYMVYIWLGIFLITLLIEFLTTEVVSIWFSLGALISMILACIPGINYWIEIAVFFAVSLISFLALRPLINKALKRNISKSNIDEIVGVKGTIIKEGDSLHYGEVKINDVIWTAMPLDENIKLKVDQIVEVVSVKGNKLFVKPIEK